MDSALKGYIERNTKYLKALKDYDETEFDSVEYHNLRAIPGVDEIWTTLKRGTINKEYQEDGTTKGASRRDEVLWSEWSKIPNLPVANILYKYTFKPGDVMSYLKPVKRGVKANLYADKSLFDVNESIFMLPWRFSDFPEDEIAVVTTLEPNRDARTAVREISKLSALRARASGECAPRGRLKMRNELLILTNMASLEPEWKHAMKYLSALKHYVLNDLRVEEPFIEYQSGDVKILADDVMIPIRMVVLLSAAYRAMNWGESLWIEEVAALLFHNPYTMSLKLLKEVSALLQGMASYSPSQIKFRPSVKLPDKYSSMIPTEKVAGQSYPVRLPKLGEPLDWFKSFDILTCDDVSEVYTYPVGTKGYSDLNAELVSNLLKRLDDVGLKEYACIWYHCLTSLPSKDVVTNGARLHSVIEWAGYIPEDTVLAHADTLSKGALDSSDQDFQNIRDEVDNVVRQYYNAIPRSQLWTPAQFKQAIPRNMTNNSAGKGSFTIATDKTNLLKSKFVSPSMKLKFGGQKSLVVTSQSSKKSFWGLQGEGLIRETFEDEELRLAGTPVPHATVKRLERSKQTRAAYMVRVEETIPSFPVSWVANYMQTTTGTDDSTLEGYPYMTNQAHGSIITDIPVCIKATVKAISGESNVSTLLFSLDYTSWDLRLTIMDKITLVLRAFKFMYMNDPDFAATPFLDYNGKQFTYPELIDILERSMIGASYTTVYLYHSFTFNASFMPSGAKFTLPFNSLINVAIARYVFNTLAREFGVQVIHGRFMGDDNINIARITDLTPEKYEKIVNRMVELCNSVGLSINANKSVVKGDSFEVAKLYACCGMVYQALTISILKAEDPQGYVRTMEFFRALSGLMLIAATRGENYKVHEAFLTSAFGIRGSELVQENKSRDYVFYPPISLLVPKAYQGVGYSPVTDNADTLLMSVSWLREWVVYYGSTLLKLAPERGFADQLGVTMAKNVMECSTVLYKIGDTNAIKKIPLTLDWADQAWKDGANVNSLKLEIDRTRSVFFVDRGKYKGMIPYAEGAKFAIENMDPGQLSLQMNALQTRGAGFNVPKEYYYSNYWYSDIVSAVAANDAVRKIDFDTRRYTGEQLMLLTKSKGDEKKSAEELLLADVMDINYIESKNRVYEGAAMFLGSLMPEMSNVLGMFGVSGLSVPDQFATPLRGLNASTTFNGNVSVTAIVKLITSNLQVMFDKEMLSTLFVIMGADPATADLVASRVNLNTISMSVISTGYAYNGSLNAILNLTPERLDTLVSTTGMGRVGDAFISRVRRMGQLVAALGLATIKLYTGKDFIAVLKLKPTEYGRYLAKTTNVATVLGTDAFERFVEVQRWWTS